MTDTKYGKVINKTKYEDIMPGDMIVIVPNDQIILGKSIKDLLEILPDEVAVQKVSSNSHTSDQDTIEVSYNIYKLKRKDIRFIL